MEENRIPKRVLCMTLGTTRLRGRPRNRWQGEVREDGIIVGGEGWQEKIDDREEWKKLLRMARNHQSLLMPMEWNGMEWNGMSFIPLSGIGSSHIFCFALYEVSGLQHEPYILLLAASLGWEATWAPE